MRILIQIVIPLVTPIIIYALWVYIDSKRKGSGIPGWEDGKWFWVILLGICLSISSLFYFATRGADTDGKYQSPRLENGRVVPAQHN